MIFLVYHMEILCIILCYLEFKIYNLLTHSSVCFYRCNNIIKMINDLKSLYALKKDYKIHISLKDYHMQKSLVLQNYISKLLPSKISQRLSHYSITSKGTVIVFIFMSKHIYILPSSLFLY